MRNSRSIFGRRVIEALIIAALVVLAVQLLLGQWAHGQEAAPALGEEKFVPTAEWSNSSIVELKSEAKIEGAEVKLKQIVRWGDVDKSLMDQAGDLVVARMERGKRVQDVELDEIKRVLEGAGVNLGLLRFSGAAGCRVTWSDPRLQTAMEQAVLSITKNNPRQPTTRRVFSGMPTPTEVGIGAPAADQRTRTLREILMADLVDRLNLPAEAFVVRFAPKDEALINLGEPHFRFSAQCRNTRSIGNVTWDVDLTTDAGTQKVAINANVGVWQTQLIAARPVGYRQVFTDDSITEKRIVVEELKSGAPMTKAQVVGQQAGQDITAGCVVTPRMVEAVQVVRTGQLITVTVEYGSVVLRWVGEARESGAVGQTIRVRKVKADFRQEYMVQVTGPQEGKLVGGNSVASR